MREHDMRLRVERFIQTRLRSMLMPATLGLGMALGGCNSDGLNADDGGTDDAATNADTVSATGGTSGTGGAGTGGMNGTGGAPGSGGKTGNGGASGGAQGTGGVIGTGGTTTVQSSGGISGSGGSTTPATKYIAPVPLYTAVFPDAGAEVSLPAPEYIAPIVKQDAGVAVRYMAQMPPDASDPGRVVPMYLAQMK